MNGLSTIMLIFQTKKPARGFGIIEVLVGSAIISIALFALADVVRLSHRAVSGSLDKTQARFLAQEGLEVVRIARDQSYSQNINPALDGVLYYLSFSTTTSLWSLSAAPQPLIDGMYDRTLSFSSVWRNGSDDDITASTSPGGVLDPGTKEVVATIAWNGGQATTSLSTYVTNLFNN